MKHLGTLIAMQLKDKIDLSWIKSKKKALRQIVITLFKFTLLTCITYLILFLCNKVQLFSFDEAPTIVILVLTLTLVLSLIGCTFELMKNLYFSEDNKVLITLPVNANKIFVSKLAVYYIYELKKSIGFLIPITFGCNMLLVTTGLCSPIIFVWMWIPLILIIALPVLLGALLSIPTMFIYRLIKKSSIIELILFLITLGLILWGVVSLINLIPEKINLINQWPIIRANIRLFLRTSEEKLFITSELVYLIIGKKQITYRYTYTLNTLLVFGIVLAICAVLIILVYFISRPIFFSMMTKNFENNKNQKNNGTNKKHSKYMTFINKEFIINLRTINISVNYLMVYIIVPILVLLLNRFYIAMETSPLGQRLIYTFNVLLILLPLLASNALVATYYSREGRAGYLKKTKPIQAIYPLLAKLVFNIIFSIPTIIASVAIFGGLNKLNVVSIVLFALSVLFIHVGHMIYSATLDIMNPQNEQYATTGLTIDNPNENKSTLSAFILSFVFAIIAYKLLSEAQTFNNEALGFVKILLIGVVFIGCNIYMMIKRVKAFYYEIQGR